MAVAVQDKVMRDGLKGKALSSSGCRGLSGARFGSLTTTESRSRLGVTQWEDELKRRQGRKQRNLQGWQTLDCKIDAHRPFTFVIQQVRKLNGRAPWLLPTGVQV